MRAWDRDSAPVSPILFLLKFKLVREEFTVRDWEKNSAPVSQILFNLNSNLSMRSLL